MVGTMGKGRSENERSGGAEEREGVVGKEAAGGGSSAAAPSQAHLKQRPPAHPTVPLLSGCLMQT